MEPGKKSNGALIGLVIIVILLILGGVYLWRTSKSTIVVENPQPTPSTVGTEDSNDLNTLEQDINGADTNAGVDTNSIN